MNTACPCLAFRSVYNSVTQAESELLLAGKVKRETIICFADLDIFIFISESLQPSEFIQNINGWAHLTGNKGESGKKSTWYCKKTSWLLKRDCLFFSSSVKMSLATSPALQNNYCLCPKLLDRYVHGTKGPEDSPCQATLTFFRIQALWFL